MSTSFQPDPAKLKAARMAAGISQVAMSRLLGMGRSQVCNIENGLSLIRSDDLATWCRTCGIENAFDLYSDLPSRSPTRPKSSIVLAENA